MFSITLESANTDPQTLNFDRDEITIGRMSSSDIHLDATNISKQHSRIVLRDGRYFIIDRKSTNGTFINGNRVSVPMTLKDGDVVYIGDFSLKFNVLGRAPKKVAPKAVVDQALVPKGTVKAAAKGKPTPPPLNQKVDLGEGQPLVPQGAMTMEMPAQTFEAETPTAQAVVEEDEDIVIEETVDEEIDLEELEIEEQVFEEAALDAVTPQDDIVVDDIEVGDIDVEDIEIEEQFEEEVTQEPDEEVADADITAEIRLELYEAAMDFEEFTDPEDFIKYSLDDEEFSETILKKIMELYQAQGHEELDKAQSERVMLSVLKELLGYGPLEELLFDDDVREIFVNGPGNIVIIHKGVKEVLSQGFISEESLFNVLVRMLDPFDVEINEDSAIIDATLPEIKIAGVLYPYAGTGTALRITKAPGVPANLEGLQHQGVLDEEIADYLLDAVTEGKTIMVSGSRRQDRIDVLGALAMAIPQVERLALLGTGLDVQLTHEDQLLLDTATGDVLETEMNLEAADLYQHLGLLAPDRIVVADVKVDTALPMILALDGGLSGSIISLYGTTCKDGLSRLTRMLAFAGDYSSRLIDEMLLANIDVLVNVRGYKNGERRIICVAELEQGKKGIEVIRKFYYDFQSEQPQSLEGEFKKVK